MSDLQCPARIIFARAGRVDELVAALAGERVSGVWAAEDRAAQGTAQQVAKALGLWARPDDRLRDVTAAETDTDAVERVSRLVQEVADLGRGETTLIITDPGLIGLAVRRLCATIDPAAVRAHPLPPGGTVLVEVDSVGWSCADWPCG